MALEAVAVALSVVMVVPRVVNSARSPPEPRPSVDEPPPPSEHTADHDAPELAELAEQFLGDAQRVSVADLLREAGKWLPARRVLSGLVAIHHREDLPYALAWGDGVRVDPDASLTWVTDGWFHRLGPR